jgi:hypothetical protein
MEVQLATCLVEYIPKKGTSHSCVDSASNEPFTSEKLINLKEIEPFLFKYLCLHAYVNQLP